MLRQEQSGRLVSLDKLKAPSAERAFLNVRNELDQRGVSGSDIDNVSAIDFKISGGKFGPEREHLLLAIARDGIRDVVWYSPPLSIEDGPDTEKLTIVTKPGLSEIIEDGVGWEFHKELANRNPTTKVLTHATEGFGPSAQHGSIWELSGLGLDTMAKHGQELLATYFHDERLATVGTSMGTVIFHKLLTTNRLLLPDEQLNIVANINYAPALVDPANILKDMFLKFPGLMLIDGVLEVLARTSPHRLKELCKVLTSSKPGRRDIPPILRQIVDLRHGVHEGDVLINSEYYNTAAIVGQHDPVGQIPMWERMPNVALHVIPGRGHAIAVNPRKGARKVTTTLNEILSDKPQDPDQLLQAA